MIWEQMNEVTKETYTKKRWKPWLKALLIKFWFYGAVYFFIGWGLFLVTSDQLDLVVILGLVMGAVNDLAVNRILRGMESPKLEYHPFMMVTSPKFYAFPINLLYGLLLSFMVAYTYNFINIAVISANGLSPDVVPFGAEPIMFGVFSVLYDISLTHLFRFVFKRKDK